MNSIISKLVKVKITDIFQIGISQVGFKDIELITDYNIIYIQTINEYIKIESFEQNSKLLISIVNNISYGLSPEEEDLPPYKNSIVKLLLNDDDLDNYIDSLVIFGEELNNKNNIICQSLMIYMSNGEEVFFDPSYYWGINIGGQLQKELWIINNEERTSINSNTY